MKRSDPPTWEEILDLMPSPQEARDYSWGGKLIFLPNSVVEDRVMTRPLPDVEKIARAFHKHILGSEWYQTDAKYQKLLCSAVEYLLACNVILPGPGLDSFDVG